MTTSTETSLQCQDHEEDSKCERKKGTYQFSKAYKALFTATDSLVCSLYTSIITQHKYRVWYKVKSVHKSHTTLPIN